MSIPPDDLPRSPTGRIPQWVRAQAAGRPVDAPAWRAAAPAGPTRARRIPAATAVRRRRPRVLVALVLLTTLVLGARWAEQAPAGLAGTWSALPGTLRATVEGAVLPPPGERAVPRPGYEEAAAPLGVAPPAAAGAGGYEVLYPQTAPDGQQVPVTWSPCRPIHYVVDATGAPPGFPEQVAAAVAEVSAGTGLTFVADGAATESPDQARPAFLPDRYGDRWAPVLVQFADHGAVPGLAGRTVGLAGVHRATDPRTGVAHLVSAVVHLDVELLGQPDRDGAPAYVPVLRHELGHVAGLGHVGDPTQLMHPESTAATTFQEGDRAGLAALGRGACAPNV